MYPHTQYSKKTFKSSRGVHWYLYYLLLVENYQNYDALLSSIILYISQLSALIWKLIIYFVAQMTLGASWN